MKHICIVTSVHPWDDVRVNSRMAATFVEAGYQVTWVGPDRATVAAADRDVRLPGVDYQLYPAGGGRVGRLAAGRRSVTRAARVKDVDWWYTPDPDVASLLPALARSSDSKTIFDIHESYHGGLLNRWFPGGKPPNLVRELMRRRIAGTCTRIDLVIGVSHGVLEPYCQGHPETLVIRNLAPAFFDTLSSPAFSAGSPMWMLHGKIGDANGTERVVEAVGLLPEKLQNSLSVVMLDVEGTTDSARQKVIDHVEASRNNSLVIRSGVPHAQMADLMASCYVGLISYQRDLGHDSLPNRLFEYMAAGLAVIAPAYSPEIVRILEVERAGLTADFEVPSEIAEALTWCIENPDEVRAMGSRARTAYLERYTWDREAERLVAALRNMET